MLQVNRKDPTMVGQFNTSTMIAVVVVLRKIWGNLHRVGRFEECALEARYRIHQALGSMSSLWAAIQTQEKRRFKTPQDAEDALAAHLSRVGVRDTVANQVIQILAMLASRAAAIRVEAEANKGTQAQVQLLIGARVLERSFWELVGTGILAEIPNSLRNVSLDKTALRRLAASQIELFSSFESLSRKAGVPADVRFILGRVAGSTLFEGVRAQRDGRVGPTAEDLVRYYTRNRARSLRGFYATLGLGVFELGTACLELLELSSRTRSAAKRETLSECVKLLSNTVFAVFSSGALSAVAG